MGEAESSRNERYFRTLIENATEAITILDPDGTIRYVSPAVKRLTGYSAEERIGHSLLDLLHEDDLPRVRAELKQLLEQPSTSINGIARLRHRDGSWRWIDYTATNLLADSDIRGVVVNWRDVTNEVEAASLLKEHEHFFRSIIESSTDILMVFDRDRRIRYVSPAGEALAGYDSNQIVGTSGVQLIHPDDIEDYEDALASIYDDDAAAQQGLIRVKSSWDDYRILDVRARNLLDDPLFEGVVVDARDVTDSNRTEEALRKSEQRFRSIVEQSSEGITICDANGNVTFLNERFAQMLGYDPDELMGVHVLSLIAEENRAAAVESSARGRGSGQPEQMDVGMLRKDGERIAVIMSTSSLFDRSGNYYGSLSLYTDVTDRMQLEAQRRAVQKIEAIAQLAGGVAHDFNNLLTAIRGHVDLLLHQVPADSSFREDIYEIRKSADRAAALTKQLLAFSRRQILQPRVLAIDDVIAGAETLLKRLIGENCTLAMTLDADEVCVRVDRSQLERILMNLAVNARDAMPDGGEVSMHTRVVDLDDEFVRANPGARPGSYVELEVRDTGLGMSHETLSHLFEPFFTTKALGRGTGLGLATIYGIVKQSDGYILVDSRPEVGSRFRVFLPRVACELGPERDSTPTREAPLENHTVLVADDEDAVRSLACRVLRSEGYRVLEATDGAEAINVANLHDGAIDLLLSDLVMPQMGGRELMDELLKIRPGLKVIFMSGYTTDALLQRGIRADSCEFLEKPFTPVSLLAKLREVLNGN